MLQMTSNMLGFLLLIAGILVGVLIAWGLGKREEQEE